MTAWVRRQKLPLLVVGIILCLVGGMLYEQHRPDEVVLNGRSFTVEVVDTPAKREQGLSGRNSLAPTSAMLFVFDKPAEYCFWMKDMRFGIDMVWLDEDSKVVAIEQQVQPSSYPKRYCHSGVRVIELAAGTAERIKLQVGDQVSL